ncbi:hypothetical protein Syun_030871 [Stephania yunnanensis]|uniref:WRKY domain-containing protein n=1 Tax=Stephania yunnanensis TaxID=152371 RepID=A0AAP0DYM0_9MAGN
MSSSSSASFPFHSNYFMNFLNNDNEGDEDNDGGDDRSTAPASSNEFHNMDDFWLHDDQDYTNYYDDYEVHGDDHAMASIYQSPDPTITIKPTAACSGSMTAGNIDSGGTTTIAGVGLDHSPNSNRSDGGEREKTKKESKSRVAFRTKSEREILDDGFKWRKYGKKMVKNSPNPRNYYRCSIDGCPVKKRVERDGDDPSYVITTYEGVHTHESFSF